MPVCTDVEFNNKPTIFPLHTHSDGTHCVTLESNNVYSQHDVYSATVSSPAGVCCAVQSRHC